MRRLFVLLVLVLGYSAVSVAQEAEALHLVKRVSVPGVQRKWDHFGVDLAGNRLFVSSEEEPAIEVVDLQSGEHLRTLMKRGTADSRRRSPDRRINFGNAAVFE